MTSPLQANPAAEAFLAGRRSRPAKTLAEPGPDAEAITRMLTLASRTPDHGMLTPWRFIVIQGPARERLAQAVRDSIAGREEDPVKVDKAAGAFLMGPVCVAVVASPKESPKIPQIEQTLTTGAVCAGLVNAALAMGWGANWLTGWRAFDRPFVEQTLGLTPSEWIAGYVHIGTETVVPDERRRPDVAALTKWVES